MAGFETRFERLELKYLIDESRVEEIRREISAYCEPDPHNPSETGLYDRPCQRGYSIRSLYLDSPGLAFHMAKQRGDPDRLKLRVRTYSDHSPAVLELKRKYSDVTDKKRAVVERGSVPDAVAGLAKPLDPDPKAQEFLDEFAMIAARYGAMPMLNIRYEREAYRSLVDGYARVTFDRHIAGQRTYSWDLIGDPDEWIAFDDHWREGMPASPVVLEIKCHALVPWWVTELVRNQRLHRRAFSKYSIGIYLMSRFDGSDVLASRSAKVMV
jgi:hypothetical protein